jgi:hypothetical protein
MNAAVLAIAVAAQGDHRRAAGKIEREFIPDRAAQIVAFELGGEPREGSAIALTVKRETAVLPERREIGNRGGQTLRPHKVLDHDKIERIAAERRGAQPIEIEQAQACIGRDRIHAGIIADLPPRPSSLRCIAEVGAALVVMRARSTMPA